ncbi:uncharacterized protein LOC129596198 isoform X2 [Paramacrobiotus metropolitanus]|uniref:uncharacterized protein LOC129596198 isoform X2 n=1 Tax=Paramacrobiotus metropolitanus TaxID=2943436 RepID=UPI00244635A2|nr:uncharacterized protein LOC129596198 isoform X2 [Paramacrobiotus metropolitanus]
MNTPIPKPRELFRPRLLLFGALVILCGIALMILDTASGIELKRRGAYIYDIWALAVHTFAGVIYVILGVAEIYTGRPLNADEKAENRQALLHAVVRLNLLAAFASLALFLVVTTFESYYESELNCKQYRCSDIVTSLLTLRIAVISCIAGIVLVCSVTECTLAYMHASTTTTTSSSDEEPLLVSPESFVVSDAVKKIVEAGEASVAVTSDEKSGVVFLTSASKY